MREKVISIGEHPPVNSNAGGVRNFASLHSNSNEQGFSGIYRRSPEFAEPRSGDGRAGAQSPEVRFGEVDPAMRPGYGGSAYVTPARSYTPGEQSARPSPSETVDVVQAVTAGMKGVMDGVMEKFSELQGSQTGDAMRPDRIHAMSHLEFKTSAPTIRDDDPDLDGYDRKFDTMIESYACGGKQPR